jgi:predicted nucleotidyltransferase
MKRQTLALPKDKIADFCRRHHIRTLGLFGSVLRDDFGSDSDVDVLVEFESGHVPGFIGLARMEAELSQLLQRRVDLNTPSSLSDQFRERVLREAEVQYGPASGPRHGNPVANSAARPSSPHCLPEAHPRPRR